MTLRDLKDALSNARKADTTHVRRAFQVYTARPCEYGNIKYERANYRRPTDGTPHIVPTAKDFTRYRAYLRAARDHIDETLDAMELHLATDPRLEDVAGMKRAAYAIDTDVSPGSEWLGPSNLPHVAPACASLNMAITQAVDCGLLPADPGTPWDTAAVKPDPESKCSKDGDPGYRAGGQVIPPDLEIGDSVRAVAGVFTGAVGTVAGFRPNGSSIGLVVVEPRNGDPVVVTSRLNLERAS